MRTQTEQSKKGADEHILVCLSSSPSNARIIHTAAKMAKVLHARFTAIYVQTDTVINDEDQSRLSQNIQLAQRLGAEIVMTHGEDVPLQISEYVRLSDVTKIVIGQSSARRRGLFGRPTLTEKLIASAPDVDIHIIPDALNYTKPHRRRLFLGAEIPSLRDIAITVLGACRMHGDRVSVRSSRLSRYQYRYGIHPRCADDLRFDQRIPLQYGKLTSKCCIVRIFPYRTQVVLSDLCRRLSRYLCSHAGVFRSHRHACLEAERSCKALGSLRVSCAGAV